MRPYVKRPYRSFNDFFTREILPTERMIDCDPIHLVSPCDGKISIYPLDETAEFAVKGSVYTLERILKNPSLAKRYEGGLSCVFRLCVDGYHRYSYPADGEKSENIRISGILHTVNPIAVESVPVYHENTREYCLLKTERFGTLIQMEVGAMMVGRICNYHGPRYVKKGSEKGRFEFWRFHDPSAGPERPGNFPGEISEKHGSGHRDPGGNGRVDRYRKIDG